MIYAGKSIKASGETLRVVTFRVRNVGTAAMKLDDYISPVGIKLANVKLIETPVVIDGSTSTVRSSALPRIAGDDVVIAPTVLRPDEFVEVKVRGLSKRDGSVTATATGEVDTTTEIPLLNLPKLQQSDSFWLQVFAGSPIIHLTRVAILIGVLAAVAVVATIVLVISDTIRCRATRGDTEREHSEVAERRAIADAYRKEPTYIQCTVTSSMLHLFIHYPESLHHTYRLLEKTRLRQETLESLTGGYAQGLVREVVAGGKTRYA